MSPIVSVLMTSFNRERYISEAIESVLSSSVIDFELIIVDDCSTDRTYEIIQQYSSKDNRIRAFRNNNNHGDYSNRNKAAGYAKGKYLKFVDSDDIIYSHGLQVMIDAMEKFPSAGFGLSSVGGKINPLPELLNCHDAYIEHFHGYGHFFRSPASAIIRREVFEQVGGFAVQKYFGDMDLWFLMAQQFPMVKFQRDLVWDRVHDISESKYESMDKNNRIIRTKIIDYYLSHDSCPLNQEEVLAVREILDTNIISTIIKSFILKFR